MENNSKKPNAKRRAVLQGSLAAPLVLTVSSPSAQTMTSLGRCLRNLNGQQGALFTTSEDNWLRNEVDVVQLRKGNDTDWYYLDPRQKSYVALTNTSKTVSALDVGALDTSDKQYKVVKTGKRWLLAWVDEKGNTYDWTVQAPNQTQSCTKSCWTSVKGG